MLRTGRKPTQNSHIHDMKTFKPSECKENKEKVTDYVASSSLRVAMTCLSLASS